MANAEQLVRDFLQRHRDSPFSASQIGHGATLSEPSLKAVLDDLIERGEVHKVSDGRFLYTNNADIASYHILREIAPNVTFEEFMRHRDEPHVLVRISRDRVVAKDPRGGI